MSLEKKINDQLKTAMLAKDEKALRALRAIKSAILLAKTAEGAGELTEADEQKMLQKLVKQRRDSETVFREQNRSDLAQKEAEEIEVIEQFLPKQLTAEELRSALVQIISETGSSTLADLGKVIAAMVKELLQK